VRDGEINCEIERCSESTRVGRLNKARQFWDAADILDTLLSDGDFRATRR
jgi:hypothetical protein